MIPQVKAIMCKECGEVISFTEYFHLKEKYCPHCGCDELEAAYMCQNCQKYISTDEEIEGFCKECAKETISKFQSFLFSNFNRKEIEFLKGIKGI